MDFSGKSVLVTGASRGIGRAIAELFAHEGASVAVHFHRNREAAESTAASLPAGPHPVFQADLADPDAARQLVDAVIDGLGGIDILVNNAGLFEEHPLPDVSYEEWQQFWQRTLALNLLGPANLSYCAARHMIERGGGRIVNVSSRGAFRGEPDAPAYGASKAGLNSLSQSMAQALAPHNVIVCAVAPGWVDTDMAAASLSGPSGPTIRGQIPLGRVASPEEVARTVVFLASQGTESLAGCIVDVNGASYLRS